MDETKELLKVSFSRLEGLIGEVKELRYKIKDVQGNVESLRSALREANRSPGGGEGAPQGDPPEDGPAPQGGGDGGQGGHRQEGGRPHEQGGPPGQTGHQNGGGGADDIAARLERIEERLDYLGAKWLELDERIYRMTHKRK